MARACDGGFRADGTRVPPEPRAGYLFRILTRQGDAAPGGATDHVVDDDMVAARARLAFPAACGRSGIMGFLVGENGPRSGRPEGPTRRVVPGAACQAVVIARWPAPGAFTAAAA